MGFVCQTVGLASSKVVANINGRVREQYRSVCYRRRYFQVVYL